MPESVFILNRRPKPGCYIVPARARSWYSLEAVRVPGSVCSRGSAREDMVLSKPAGARRYKPHPLSSARRYKPPLSWVGPPSNLEGGGECARCVPSSQSPLEKKKLPLRERYNLARAVFLLASPLALPIAHSVVSTNRPRGGENPLTLVQGSSRRRRNCALLARVVRAAGMKRRRRISSFSFCIYLSKESTTNKCCLDSRRRKPKNELNPLLHV